MIAASGAMILDAAIPSFVVPAGYWAVLSAVFPFLIAVSATRRNGNNRKNGNGA